MSGQAKIDQDGQDDHEGHDEKERDHLVTTFHSGARAAEAQLLSRVEELLYPDQARGITSPQVLPPHPIRVIVPSRSLSNHLGARFLQHFGRPVLGVSIQTVHGLARTVLSESAQPGGGKNPLTEIIIRRNARKEPALSQALDHLQDGYSSVAASVRDLLDAGIDRKKAGHLASRLKNAPPSKEITRARSILSVWDATCKEMAASGTELDSSGIQRATKLIAENARELLPSHAVLIHGFADATGVTTELLAELVKSLDAQVILDHPPDPVDPQEPDQGIAFSQRFEDRLLLATEKVTAPGKTGQSSSKPDVPEKLKLFHAPGAQAEIRELAFRVRSLLDADVAPESVAVVARNLSIYSTPLRLHFDRLGVPFSSPNSKGPLSGAGVRLHAALDLLLVRSDAPSDRWLDAFLPRPTDFDLRLALHALGAARLVDTARIKPKEAVDGNDCYRLPVRRGIWSPQREETEEPELLHDPRAYRRRVRGKELRRTVTLSRKILQRWENWPESATFSRHLDEWTKMLEQELSWDSKASGFEEALAHLQAEKENIPPDFACSYDEFCLLIRRIYQGFGETDFGGSGSGVQILDVVAARGLTFSHLFVIGLNRDVFPRAISEDPLLSDSLRSRLLQVLPDLPLKRTGHDEERFLFAQLFSASPNVTLSYQSMDDDGRSRSPSPLLERLRWSGTRQENLNIVAAPGVVAPPEDRSRPGFDPDRPLLEGAPALPAHEEVIQAGLYGSRQLFSELLPVAFEELKSDLGKSRIPVSVPDLAEARVAVLNELDPDLRTKQGRASRQTLGPYFGFLGPIKEKDDPRRGKLFITAIEGAGRCPWAVTLERLLRLEPSPDPLEALPTIDALMLGSLVHAVLECIVLEAHPDLARTDDDLTQARKHGPHPVAWPSARKVEEILARESKRIIREQGIPLTGLTQVLIDRGRPLVQLARETEWKDEQPLPVVGAELRGSLPIDVDGEEWRVHFKADRVDAHEEGFLLTDYKTGKPLTTAKRQETRNLHLRNQVKKGDRLQAIAYQLAAGGPSKGRYVFLKDGVEPEHRIVETSPEDHLLIETFQEAMKTLLRAFREGTMFPRLFEPGGQRNPKCSYCSVSEACIIGDSGAKLRMQRWIKPLDPGIEGWDDTLSDAEKVFASAFYLAKKEQRKTTATPSGKSSS